MKLETSNYVSAGDIRATWAQHASSAETRLQSLGPQLSANRLLFKVKMPVEAIECVALAAMSQLDFSVVTPDRLTPDLEAMLTQSGLAIVEDATLRPGGSSPTHGRVSVLTSGTTGLPKLVEHSWQTLNTMTRARAEERTWFVPYQPGTYAWFQMVCLGLFTPEQHLVLADPHDPINSFLNALDGGVTAVSSTPTFWRYALLNIDEDAFRRSALAVITLGGEIVDQELLDQLRRLFPRAAIRHIYASTEAGAAIVVNDGLAGFPIERLNEEKAGHGADLKIQSSRLHVRSAFTSASSLGDGSQWIDTGDLVEVRGDRVYFLGRESGMINVGGLKVMPSEIEDALLAHPDVLWAQVRARHAPIVGEVPAAQVVMRGPPDPGRDESLLVAHLSARLQPHAIPRAWKFLTDIPLGPGQKSRL
jgi:acyl-CoA synthetase (AMP-forming)/AMP-acid ligase II